MILFITLSFEIHKPSSRFDGKFKQNKKKVLVIKRLKNFFWKLFITGFLSVDFSGALGNYRCFRRGGKQEVLT